MLIARFLLYWYHSQLVCVHWNSIDSAKLTVKNGVCQGHVLSPILFTINFMLIASLLDSLRGCY